MSYNVTVTTINIEDIQRDLQSYLQQVEAGETVVIVMKLLIVRSGDACRTRPAFVARNRSCALTYRIRALPPDTSRTRPLRPPGRARHTSSRLERCRPTHRAR